jgi:hypothetical protein
VGIQIDWKRLFVVKGIGDEIWLLYTIEPNEIGHLPAAAVRIMGAAQLLVQQSIGWSATAHDLGPNFDPEAEEQEACDSMNLSYKVYIDLIADALEISALRADALAPKIPQYLLESEDSEFTTRFGADEALLASRLNIGFFETTGRRRRQITRADYIGHDVDRFFRTTKAAIPGVVTIGEMLFDKLQIQSEVLVQPGLKQALITYERQPGLLAYWHDLLYVESILQPKDLKGIERSYRSYHFATRPQLNGIWRRGETDQLLAPNIDKFPRSYRRRLRAQENKRSKSKEY